MSVEELIRTRRNVRKFKQESISQEQVLAWLATASYAPNHRFTQPWQVLWIGPETRHKLNHKTNFADAPVVLAFLSASGQSPLERDENLTAVSCMMENFCLLAHAAGAGTRWSSHGASGSSREVLGIPEGYDVVSILAVGYPEELPEARERVPMSEKFIVMQ